MSDLIRRDDVLRITEETGALETQVRVRQLPAAQAECPKEADWVYVDWINSVSEYEPIPAFKFECSRCLREMSVKNLDLPLPGYCSQCGAMMRGGMQIDIDGDGVQRE